MTRLLSILFVATLLFTLAPQSSAQGYALRLEGGAEIHFPFDSVMHTGEDATFEGWVRPVSTSPTTSIYLVSRYQGSAEHKELAVGSDGRIYWLYAGSPWAHHGACRETGPGVFPFDGQFHHVALVRNPGGAAQVYLDGVLVASTAGGTCCWLTCNVIEAPAPTKVLCSGDGAGWEVRGIRLSDVVRYSGAFVPSATWVADSDDALHLPLEEGAGATVVDAGPAGQLGTISGTYSWVSFDCNNNGIPDADDIAAGAPDCDGNFVLDSCQIAADASLDWNGDGVLDACASANYCAVAANSTGQFGLISAQGSPVISDIDFSLVGSNIPPGELGYFLMSQSSDLVVPFGSGAGVLCLGTPIVRMNQASDGGAILTADAGGQMSFSPDLGGLPQGTVLSPGDVWYFQLWYRDTDPVLQTPTSNSSDGIEVMFR